jgi:pimeloyl-ACP methyl ester carboxylesterase
VDSPRRHGPPTRFTWLEAALAKSRLPTWIVWRHGDEAFGAATFAERFKRLLPHAKWPHLATGRHFVQEDSGSEIARLIAAFLHRQGGA